MNRLPGLAAQLRGALVAQQQQQGTAGKYGAQ
jgi:hypothetical protein